MSEGLSLERPMDILAGAGEAASQEEVCQVGQVCLRSFGWPQNLGGQDRVREADWSLEMGTLEGPRSQLHCHG